MNRFDCQTVQNATGIDHLTIKTRIKRNCCYQGQRKAVAMALAEREIRLDSAVGLALEE